MGCASGKEFLEDEEGKEQTPRKVTFSSDAPNKREMSTRRRSLQSPRSKKSAVDENNSESLVDISTVPLVAIRDCDEWTVGRAYCLSGEEEDHYFPEPLGGQEKYFSIPAECERREMNGFPGFFYTGQWNKNRKEGLGRMEAPTGVFTGVFVDDQIRLGRFEGVDGKVFEGLFTYDGRFDIGLFRFPDGSSYYGRGLPMKTGLGKEMDCDGGVYVGNWFEDLKEGKGVYRCPDGSVYRGDFHKGHLWGDGTWTWPDCREYRGQFFQSKKHGIGKFSWPNGEWYHGEWENELQHGYGWKGKVGGEKQQGVWDKGVLLKWVSDSVSDLTEVEISPRHHPQLNSDTEVELATNCSGSSRREASEASELTDEEICEPSAQSHSVMVATR